MAVVESGGVLLPTAGYRVARGPAAGLTFYSGLTADYAELYRTQPNLRLVIRFLARNIASLGLKAYERVSDEERRPVDPTSELGRFLKSPTPDVPKPVTRHRWIRGIVADLALFDDAYLLKVRNAETGRLNAVRLPPQNVRPVTADGESELWPSAYELTGSRGTRLFAADQVVHFHGDNPADPRAGVSPIESLRRILAEDESSGAWREQYWRNAARMSGVIERPVEAPKWDRTKRERFLEGWRDAWSGAGGAEAGGTPVLEDGMTFKEATFSAKDSEYLGARRLSREECAAAYFIPPVFVGILENANFANIKEQHVSLYADTLGPWLDEITQDLELQLLPEFPDVDETTYLEFNIAAKLAGSFEEQATVLQTATGAPWLLRNEARARMNLAPIPGGDEPVVPLNVLVGGQASPTDSDTSRLNSAPAPSSSSSTRTKAISEFGPRYAVGWQEAHRRHLAAYFADQGDLVLARLESGMTLEESFPVADWNELLADRLFGLSLEMTADLGGAVAEELGAELDVSRAETWLRRNAEVAAERINSATMGELVEAVAGVPRRGLNSARKALEDELAGIVDLDLDEDAELPDPWEPVRNLFAVAVAARATEISLTRVTMVGQWARREAASQAGARSKTWVSSGAPNSRHAALDGETVPLGSPFSNGAMGPGDPTLGADETAGCLCSLEFST